jgi:hypothetical protein
MRAFACILIIFGIVCGGITAYDQFYVMRQSKEQHIVLDVLLISNKDTDTFHRALMIQWFGSGVAVAIGVILLLAARRQDRLDPLSPNFDWKDEDEK